MQNTKDRVPFGYRLDANGQLTSEASEQAIIETIQKLIERGFTLQDIAKELEAVGQAAKQAKALTAAMKLIGKWREAGVSWNDIAVKLEENGMPTNYH